jgi:type VI secretion system protein ImpD
MSRNPRASTAASFALPDGLATLCERLAASGEGEALALCLGLAPGDPPPGRDALVDRLALAIAAIDELLGAQLDAVLHHPRLQALEAAWRGVLRLIEQVDDEDRIKIRLLDVTWKELVRDLERAIEFDQSHLFRKVYSAEFGTPGGEPYGVLIGDYEIRHRRSREHPEDDVGALRAIAEVAAAAFAPFIAAAHPSLFGLDSFREMERPIDFSGNFRTPEFAAWNGMRRAEDTRFVGLVLPRILMRAPYRDDPTRAGGFPYREDVSAADGSGHLWGSAAWAFGEVLIRTFAESGWLAGIRGVERDAETGGLVTSLPAESFRTDRPGLVPKGAVEVQLTAGQEKELGELGFIALTHCHGTPYAAFYGNQAVHAPGSGSPGSGGAGRGTHTVAEISAKLSSMLQYMFCVSRFAHYIKVIARDKVGSFSRAEDIEDLLRKWLIDYATSNENASAEMQARYPLRDAGVEVRDVPGRPGVYQTVIHLRPHYQLDQMTSSVKLVTELFAGRDI